MSSPGPMAAARRPCCGCWRAWTLPRKETLLTGRAKPPRRAPTRNRGAARSCTCISSLIFSGRALPTTWNTGSRAAAWRASAAPLWRAKPSPGPGSPRATACRRTGFPAARSIERRWRAPRCSIRCFCCSTSRPPTSMARRARRCSSWCARSLPRAIPFSSRRTIRRSFASPPSRRSGRSAGHVVAALGADARVARRARAGVRAAARAPFALRPAAGGGLQVRRHPEARSLARRDRRGAAASERSAYRRRRERRAHRDQAAVASPRRPPGDRKLYRQIPETGMNQGLLSVDDALQLLLSKARAVVDIEEVPTLEATSRVLARAQRSTMEVPPMDNSAMDGYAVRTMDGARLRVAQKIMAGSTGKPLEPGTAARIFTGAPIPPGADAVVMQEHCEVRGDEVLIKKAPKAGDWIRLAGSDVRKGGEILPAGERLLPQDTR